MSDLSYTIEVKGVQDLDKLGANIEKLTGALNAGKGSGKALSELKQILVGMKGSSSVLEDLKNSVQGLNSAAATLNTGFAAGLKSLNNTLKSEFKQLRQQFNMLGAELGGSLSKSIDAATPEAVKSVQRQGRAITAEAKAVAVAMNNAMGDFQLFNPSTGLKGVVKNGNAEALKRDIEGFQQMNKLRIADEQRTVAELNAVKRAASIANVNNYFKEQRARIEAEKSALAQMNADNAAALKRDLDGYRHMLSLRIAAAAKASAMDPLSGATAQVARAQSTPVGSFSRLSDRQVKIIPDTYGADALKATKANAQMSSGLKTLTKDMGDTHSMARGLASGFNLLWLTWGNLAPLFIGAAISNGFMQTAKQGMAVAHTLQVIASLGKETGDSVAMVEQRTASLTARLIELGNGIYGPQQLAEAMQILSLAGLKTNEVLTALVPTLNLAVAGTTDLKTAADVLVSITTAFGTGAAGFRQASDIIVRAAADSKASVESIGEAMKTASVVGEQYGATITDVAALAAMMANLGIQGTAAGTAIRNMMVDMSERTPKTAKIMKQFGLVFRDDLTGNMKPLIENVTQLDRVLRGLDGISQKNLLQALFSERGGKAAIAALAEYRKQMVDANGTALEWTTTQNRLTQTIGNMEKAAGDAAIAAAEMSQSTQNSFKSVGSTIQNSMFQAFQAMEPQLYLLSVQLKKTFSSPEFISALTLMVTTIAKLAQALANVAPVLGVVALAFGTYKVGAMLLAAATRTAQTAAMGLVATFPAIASGAGVAAAQITALAAAKNADAVASAKSAAGNMSKVGALGLILRFVPMISLAVTVGATAWSIYETFFKKANDTGADYANTKSGEIVKALQEETMKMATMNALRAEGLTALQAEIALKERSARTSVTEAFAGNLSNLGNKADASRTAYASSSSTLNSMKPTDLGYNRQLTMNAAYKRAYEEDTANYAKAYAEKEKAASAVEDAIKHHVQVARESSAIANEDMRRQAKETQATIDGIMREAGNGKFSVAGEGGGGSTRGANVGVGSGSNKLKEIETTILNQREYIANLKAEDAAARPLTEAEKTRNSVVAALNTTLTANARAVYEQALASANVSIALEREIAQWKQKAEIQKAWVADYGAMRGVEEEMANELARIAQLQDEEKLKRAAVNDEMKISQQSMLTEIALIGQSSTVRENALIDLRAEIELQKELKRIKDSDAYTSDASRNEASNSATMSSTDQRNIEKAANSAKRLQTYLDPGSMKDYGNEASKAFKKIVSPIQTLAKAIESYSDRMSDVAEIRKRIANDSTLTDAKKEEALTKNKSDEMRVQLKGYGDMAAAAAGFFDQESSGYKTLMAVSQAFHAAEMAYSMSMIATKAILAVVNAGTNGDGYTAVARMAAVAAFIGSLGVSVGGGGGGGAGASDEYKKPVTGTGTVLGMEGEKSESLVNSIELLTDNSKIELMYTQKMLSELTKVKEGILGLAGEASSDYFIRGFASGMFGDEFLDSGIGFLPGQSVADIIAEGVQGFGFNLLKPEGKGAQAMWSNLSEDFTQGIGRVLGGVYETVMTAADSLGLGGQEVANRMLSLIPTLGDTSTYAANGMAGMIGGGIVSLADMSGEEIQEELEGIFSAVGDQMAAAALPALRPFQRIGEGMFETLMRVTTGIESAEYALEQMGFTAIAYTDIIRTAGDIDVEILRQSLMRVEEQDPNGPGWAVSGKPTPTFADGKIPLTGVAEILNNFVGTAEELVELYSQMSDVRNLLRSVGEDYMDLTAMMVRGAGGIENLQSGLSDYLTEFFSEAEQSAAATARLTERFTQLGIKMPSSIEAFRQMVEGIDTNTSAGQMLFGQMMSLAGSFASVMEATSENSEANQKRFELEQQLLRLTGQEALALTNERNKELEALRALDPALVALQERVWALEDAAVITARRYELEQELLRATGQEALALNNERQRELDALRALDPALVGIQQAIWDITDAAAAAAAAADSYFIAMDAAARTAALNVEGASAIDKFFGTVTEAANTAAIDAAKATEAAARTAASAWGNAANSIKSAIEKIQSETLSLAEPDVNYASRKAILDDAVVKALAGDVDAAGKVSGYADEFLKASLETSVDRSQYLRDRAMAEAKLASVFESAEAQRTVQETIADASAQQVTQLQSLNQKLTDFGEDLFEVLSKMYPDIDREGANAVGGALAQAQSDYDRWFQDNNKEGMSTGKDGYMTTRLSGGNAMFTGRDGHVTYIRQGESIVDVAKRDPEIRAIWENAYGIKLPAFAKGGYHDGGWAMVGENGPELANFGSSARIYNAVDSSKMLDGGGSMAAEIRDLKVQVQYLLNAIETGNAERRAGDSAQVGLTRQIVKKLDQVTEGDVLRVTEVVL